jgi:hypothetical protein
MRKAIAHFEAPLDHDHPALSVTDARHQVLPKASEECDSGVVWVDKQTNVWRQPT